MNSEYNLDDNKATPTNKPNGHAIFDNLGAGGERPFGQSPLISDNELIQKAERAKNGEKFVKLWRGDWAPSYRSHEAAASALCMMLAHWTARDPERMDRLFRRSGLMWPKWDALSGEQTYGHETIAETIAKTHEVYSSIEAEKELQDVRQKIGALLARAKATKDVRCAFEAAPLIAQLPATEAGPVKMEFRAAFGEALNLNDLNRAISEAARERKNSARRAAASGLPVIMVTDRPLRDVANEALRILNERNSRSNPPHILVRANSLVRVIRDGDDRAIIQNLTATHLRGNLTRAADFLGAGPNGDLKHKYPPENVVRDILERGEWNFPGIDAIVQAPIVKPDGTILSKPGYDATTRLVYSPPSGFRLPRIPEKPTSDDVARARALVEEVICNFPFVDRASMANTIGLMLTLVARQTVSKVPLALIDAPDTGTGKSLLAEILCLIAAGQVPPVITECGSEEEWGKAITSLLLEGSTINIIDNVALPLGSVKLAAVITASIFKHRILGRNEAISFPNRGTWLATGNDIRLAGDLPRRCYLIRMDAGVARPYEGRSFKHDDLPNWVSENRGNILAALLTLARSWFAAGKPAPKVASIGGFEEWACTIGGILEHIGIEGLLENRREVYDHLGNDQNDDALWERLIARLLKMFAQSAFECSNVLDLIRNGNGDVYNELPPALKNALSRSDESFTKSLGKAFSKREGRKYGFHGWRLERAGERGHAVLWKIEADR